MEPLKANSCLVIREMISDRKFKTSIRVVNGATKRKLSFNRSCNDLENGKSKTFISILNGANQIINKRKSTGS